MRTPIFYLPARWEGFTLFYDTDSIQILTRTILTGEFLVREHCSLKAPCECIKDLKLCWTLHMVPLDR